MKTCLWIQPYVVHCEAIKQCPDSFKLLNAEGETARVSAIDFLLHKWNYVLDFVGWNSTQENTITEVLQVLEFKHPLVTVTKRRRGSPQ